MQERRATGNDGNKKGGSQERRDSGNKKFRFGYHYLRTFVIYQFTFSFDIGSFENEALFACFMLGPRKINISFRFDLLIDKKISCENVSFLLSITT